MATKLEMQTRPTKGYTHIDLFKDGTWSGYVQIRTDLDATKEIRRRMQMGYVLINDAAGVVSPVSEYNPQPRHKKQQPSWMKAS